MGALRYVLRNLARRRSRALLGALGIFLTLALLTAIKIGLDSVSLSYVDLVSLQAGKADVVVTAEGSDLLRPKAFDPGEAEKKLAGMPILAGVSPRLYGLGRVMAAGKDRWAVVIGIDPKREKDLDLSGFSPFPEIGPGRCAPSESLAKALAAGPGGTATVASLAGGAPASLKLGPAISRQLVLPQHVADFVVLTLEDARKVLGEPKGVHALAGALRDPRAAYDARDLSGSVQRLKDAGEDVAAALGTGFDIKLPKAAAIAEFQHVSSPVRAVFGVFAVLALAITGLLIYSLVSVAVEERIREYAILRTLGAKRRNIFALVLAESAVLCLFGVLPGVPAGALAARLFLWVVELAIGAGGPSITLDVGWTTLGLPLLAGAVLAVASALLPALNAVRWSIVDALDPMRRGQVRPAPPAEGGSRGLFLTGAALSAISVVVFFVLPNAFLSMDPSLIGTVILCLLLTILLGFTLVALGILPPVERALLAVLRGLFGPSAELAAANLGRNRRRNTTTALMFTLSVSFVLFVASLVALFSRTALAMVEQGNGADIRMSGGDGAEADSRGELAKVEGVQGVSRTRTLRSRTDRGIAYDVVIEDVVGMKHLWVTVFSLDRSFPDVGYTHGIRWDEGGPSDLLAVTGDRTAAGDAGLAPGADPPPAIISTAAARSVGVSRGDLVRLSFRLGSVRRDARFRVAAVAGAFPGFRGVRSRVSNAVGSGILISEAAFDSIAEGLPREALDSVYFVRTGEGARDESAVARRLREDYGARWRFGVESTAEEKRKAEIFYWATQALFGVLLAAAVVVAVFALIASMATSVLERRWEIGVLKALGLRRGHLFRVFLAEASALTLASGACGGAVGFGLAWMFALQAAALIELPVVFTLPWLTFAATGAVSFAAAAVASWLPTVRILRKPAAEIVRAVE